MKIKLSTRLTLFFLAAHAIVLVSFSVSLYAIAAKYLQRQADERVESAINTLVAAAEIGPAGVEWEPEERRLTFPRRAVEGSLFWEIADQDGRRLDGSAPAGSTTILTESAALPHLSRRQRNFVDSSGKSWRLADRFLRPDDRTPGQEHLRSAGEESGSVHRGLWIRVGLSLDSVRATLWNLAAGLALISSVVFALALGVSHALCRRALRPVTEMATAARAIQGADLGEHLPAPQSGDELEELAQSFNALLDRLGEAFVRQKQVTGEASHQLRTPLTAMQGQIDLALRLERSPEEYRRVLGLLQKKTRYLRQIVESLLFLARADAEVSQPSLELVDLAAWLAEHVEGWRDAHESANVQLKVAHPGQVSVRAQPVLLGELLNNLLENAVKYSPQGMQIDLELARDEAFARIVVEDHGLGMTEDDVRHIFEPFYRGRNARDSGLSGIGLGLAVAARLASVFGGKIEVESELGRGSRFVVSLPLVTSVDEVSHTQPGGAPELTVAQEVVQSPI